MNMELELLGEETVREGYPAKVRVMKRDRGERKSRASGKEKGNARRYWKE
jgi:hypothetical protein